MNNTQTDWLISCDMLQDKTNFPALDWLHSYILNQHIDAFQSYTASRQYRVGRSCSCTGLRKHTMQSYNKTRNSIRVGSTHRFRYYSSMQTHNHIIKTISTSRTRGATE